MNRAITTWALAVLLAVVTACLIIVSVKAIHPPPGPPLPWEEGYELQELE